MKRLLMGAAIAASMLAGAASAEPLKIGFVSMLSGPSAPLGVYMRDGFMLGLKHLGGKLGGAETEVITVDDELKPDVAVGKVNALLERDQVDITSSPAWCSPT
jgi:branched-chain amino acid transport system substrate-binding protein